MSIEISNIGDRKIALKGVGKMFYQDGFPISMAISELDKKGVEVSLFHVVDECMNNGWSAKTTLAKLKGELILDIDGSMKNIDWEQLEHYIKIGDQPYYGSEGGYEEQCEMKFQYLFGVSTDDVRNGNKEPINQMASIIKNNE